MYLNKLELHGFKSFADRTVVDFSPGVTVVVGPNGCGKSNIVDAVRWVIGEQRARILRSDQMASVIFNGTSKRRALGMAEVQLTIENTRGVLPTEYSEVTLGRRLYRSGESEYLLNGIQCRLKDITDLFMDTGMGAGAYSVIELKMIEELLSDNASDRRHLFEEAAGISKYKIRRGQTLRKLKTTQADLDRVRDLTDELDRQVRSLERQAKKAAKYKKLDKRLHGLELTLAAADYADWSTQLAETRARIQTLTDEAEGLSGKLTSEEASHEALRTRHVEREQAVVAAQTTLSDHVDRLRAAESDLRLSTERLSTISRDMTRLREEEVAAVERRSNLQEHLETLQGEIADVEPAYKAAEKELTDARKVKEETQAAQQKHQIKLHNLRLEERTAVSSRTEAQRTLDRLTSRLEVLDADIEEQQAALETLRSSGSDVIETAEEAERAANDASRAAEKAERELIEARGDRATLVDEVEKARSELQRAERAWDAARTEAALLEGLLSSYEEFDEPVQYLATTEDWTALDLKTVSDVISCADEHRVALETALGDFASCIVVSTETEAARAISRLRADEKGRATFVILDRLPEIGGRATPDHGTPMTSIVTLENDRFDRLARMLLGGWALLDNLEDLDTVSDEVTTGDGSRYVTHDGQWTGSGGLLHAGSPASDASPVASRISRQEQLKSVRASIEQHSEAVETARASHEEAVTRLEAIDIDEIESRTAELRRRATDLEKAHSRAEHEQEVHERQVTGLQERLDSLRTQRDETASGIETATAEVKRLTVQVAEIQLKSTAAEAAFEGIEEASREAFSLFNEANVASVQIRNRLDNLRRDLRRTQEDLEAIERAAVERARSLESLAGQKEQLEGRCAELQETIRTLQDERGALDDRVSEAKTALMETKVEISDLEARLREQRRDREQTMKQENRLAVEAASIETRLNDLVADIEEDFEIDLASYETDIPEEFDRNEAREEIRDLRGRIKRMGPVNELALDSFEEEKQRLDFMREQLDDLEKAEKTLVSTIEEINTTASRRFNETFGAIQSNFSQLFADLFGEDAKATVELADADDPLESPIEIFAKPRGKKPSVLAQLSGGEKTLTAIALLFAIYLVKPSPFCILDEVDAPLDDANINRFMNLIRSFSDSTQFILVTHNKKTMEAADRMYGITMQEQGVSKLVGVSFEDESDLELVEQDEAA